MTFREYLEWITQQYNENTHAHEWKVTNPIPSFYPYAETISFVEE